MTSTTQVAAQPRQPRQRRLRKFPWRTVFLWLVFLPLIAIVIIPLLYMFSMAFTLESNQLRFPIEWLPKPITFSNFTKIFIDPQLPIVRWFINSLVISTVGTTIIVFLSSLSGYAFARLEFPGKNFLFSVLLFSLMIPVAVTLIPAFLLLRDLKLLNTYHAIWWPAAASVTGIFLMRQHFYSIPSDLEDAARVDGANRFRIYWQICLPLVRGALVALFIFAFLGLWNDLFWPLIVLSDRLALTLPVGLLVIQQGSYVQRGLAFAGAFIASVPVLVFYAIFQRKIIAGITTAGLAGQETTMNPTKLSLHTRFQIGAVDERVFGGFLEHLGRAVYEGVYEPDSAHADDDGFRTDVMAALKRLKMTPMRYPGGNFVSGYHWEDGVGPREQRPTVRDLAWQSMETNHFGTDEFMALSRKMDWTPMMTVNLGTGTPEEARNWVEYCNVAPGTKYADMRAANGNPDPYNIKLWCLGNEMDGPWQLGHVPADQYAIRAQQAAKMMKDVDIDDDAFKHIKAIIR